MATGPKIVRPSRDFLGLFNTEVEARVLGTVMRDPEAYYSASELQPSDFVIEAHRRIWIAIQRVAAEIPPNVGNIYESLGPNVDAVGGLCALIELTAQAVEPVLLERFVKEIKKHSAECRAARLGLQINEYLETGDIERATAAAQAFLEHVAQPSGGRFSIADVRPIEELGGDELRFIASPLLVEGTVTTLTAVSGGGKSSLAAVMARAIADGDEFLGLPTLRRPVTILDRENPLAVMRERLRRLKIRSGNGLTVWGGWCDREAAGPEDADLIAYVRKSDPKPVLIFDSLIAFARCDENDAASMRAHYDAYRKLSHLGASVLVIAHTGKNDQPYRGSSDIPGSSDAGWLLQNLGENGLDRLILKDWKRRFSVGMRLNLEYNAGVFSVNGAPALSPTVVENTRLQELHSKHPSATAREWDELVLAAGIGREAGRRFRRSQ